jgi:hypothetical protein
MYLLFKNKIPFSSFLFVQYVWDLKFFPTTSLFSCFLFLNSEILSMFDCVFCVILLLVILLLFNLNVWVFLYIIYNHNVNGS